MVLKTLEGMSLPPIMPKSSTTAAKVTLALFLTSLLIPASPPLENRADTIVAIGAGRKKWDLSGLFTLLLCMNEEDCRLFFIGVEQLKDLGCKWVILGEDGQVKLLKTMTVLGSKRWTETLLAKV